MSALRWLLPIAMLAGGCTIANRIDTCDVPSDRDFQVNSTTSGDQYPTPGKSLVRLPSGLFVATWASEPSVSLTAPSEVRATRFQADGRVVPPCGSASGDTAISVAIDEVVGRPTVAVGPTPASPVYFAWRAWKAGDDHVGEPGRILVRLMTQDLCPWNGPPNVERVLEVTEPGENGAAPAIAVRSDGLEALVAWYSVATTPGAPDRLRSRPVGVVTDNVGRVETNGCDGGEYPCTHSDRVRGTMPTLSAFRDGYVLAWAEPREDALGWRMRIQRLDEYASIVGDAWARRLFGDVAYLDLAIAASDDAIVLAGAGYPRDMVPAPEDDDVYVERFDAALASVGEPVRANEARSGRQARVAIAMLPGDAVAIAWSSSAEGDEASEVYGRVLDRAGAPTFTGLTCDGSQFRLSSVVGSRRIAPSLASSGGTVLAVFGDATPHASASDRLGLSVQGRRLDFDHLAPALSSP